MARRVEAKALTPPALEDNAAERKRVLNVLAQRRYRRRRRERLQALESLDKRHEIPRAAPESISDDRSQTATSKEQPIASQDEENPAVPLSPLPVPPMTVSALIPNLTSDRQSSIHSPNDAWESILTETWPESVTEPQPFADLGEQLPNLQLDSPGNRWDVSVELQAYDTSFFTFPDDHLLDVPSLTLLNAAMKVAQRLNVTELIWDFAAVSPFYQGARSSLSSLSVPSPPTLEINSSISESSFPNFSQCTSELDITELPTHLRPTTTQRLISHHPLLDLLPWPSTRDKLIQVFHLPVNLRPENAQDPMALLQLVQDMEDGGGEGVRVHGQDPFDPCGWEIGQVMFERWWWAFEMGAVERSNQARKKRGERKLLLES